MGKCKLLPYKFFQIAFALSLISTNLTVFGQNEANHWFFGNRAGLDFTSGTPVFDPSDNYMYAFEGSTSLSDAAGNLLFYANSGDTYFLSNYYDGVVCNKNHQVMPNGLLGDTCGDGLTIQSCIALPKLDNSNQYYLFTLDPLYATNKGLRYSIIDMNLDGGNGDVTQKGVIIMPDTMAWGMAATTHANGTDYWLMVRRFQTNPFNGNLDYYAYQITPTGILPPVITPEDSLNTAEKTCKFSPDGNLLYSCNGVYNFNNSTGQLSGFRQLNPWFYDYAEFSPNSQVLYATNMGTTGSRLVQYDLTAPNIEITATVLDTGTNLYFKGGLLLGPDKKIYVSHITSSNISVINNPDSLGLACNYMYNAISLSGRNAWWEFPNLASNYYPIYASTENISSKTLPISLYPNPNDGRFSVELPSYDGNVLIQIKDISGKLIRQSSYVDKQLLKFELTVPSGVYFLQAISKNGITNIKLIIK